MAICKVCVGGLAWFQSGGPSGLWCFTSTCKCCADTDHYFLIKKKKETFWNVLPTRFLVVWKVFVTAWIVCLGFYCFSSRVAFQVVLFTCSLPHVSRPHSGAVRRSDVVFVQNSRRTLCFRSKAITRWPPPNLKYAKETMVLNRGSQMCHCMSIEATLYLQGPSDGGCSTWYVACVWCIY